MRAGDRVLDVCTGTGEMAFPFADRGSRITGVDLDADALEVARKKDRNNQINFQQMDASRLLFPDRAFDVSAVSFGLHNKPLEVREAVLREMARVTKQKVVIVDYRAPTNPVLRTLYIRIISPCESRYFGEFCRSSLEDLLDQAGLEITRQKPTLLGLVAIWVCSPRF